MRKQLFAALLAALPLAATAATGPYVQAGVGMAAASEDSSNNNGDSSSINLNGDLTGFAGNLSAGYLWGNNNFNYGLETGVTLYPNVEDNNLFGVNGGGFKNTLKVDGYNLNLLGVLQYTFNSGFLVFGKAGAAYVIQKISVKTSYNGVTIAKVSANESGLEPAGGLGIGYQFTPNMAVDLGVNVVDGDSLTNDSDNKVLANGNVLLSLTYNFDAPTQAPKLLGD